MRLAIGIALMCAMATAVVGEAPKTGLVVTFPIEGPIETEGLERAVRATFLEAKRREACAVMFEINTPGGRVDIAYAVADAILEEKEMLTVAWLRGRGALSAGAFIAYACDKVIVEPGAVAGASAPWVATSEGTASALGEKALATLRSRFHSTAEATGRPGALAEAMVDASVEVWAVWRDGERAFVKADIASGMEREDRLGVVVPRGKLFAGSPETLLEFGMADARARDETEALEAVIALAGAEPRRENPPQLSRTSNGMVLLRRLERQQAARERAVREGVQRVLAEYRKQFQVIEQAMARISVYDPRNGTYRVHPRTRRFADGGREWRERTEQCLAHVNECGRAVERLIEMFARLSGDEGQEELQRLRQFRRQLLGLRERLRKEKDAQTLPE